MLDVEDRREAFVDGDGERDETFAALGDRERLGSDLAGVEARELAPLNGSDFARMRLRLRAKIILGMIDKEKLDYTHIDPVG